MPHYTTQQSAMMYAAMKSMERCLEAGGAELPPGFHLDLSNQTVTIQFTEGTVVKREVGENGDGSIFKKATQNLYGYATWALMIDRLRKFHQWEKLKAIIKDAVREALKRPSKTVKEEIARMCPETVELIAKLQMELDIPSRKESTPRDFEAELLPTITFKVG